MLMLKKEEGDHQLCGALISLTQTSSLHPHHLSLSLSPCIYHYGSICKLDHVVSDSLTMFGCPGVPLMLHCEDEAQIMQQWECLNLLVPGGCAGSPQAAVNYLSCAVM